MGWLGLVLLSASIFVHFTLGQCWIRLCGNTDAWWGFPAWMTGALLLLASFVMSLRQIDWLVAQ